jgi:hypothetical protein
MDSDFQSADADFRGEGVPLVSLQIGLHHHLNKLFKPDLGHPV